MVIPNIFFISACDWPRFCSTEPSLKNGMALARVTSAPEHVPYSPEAPPQNKVLTGETDSGASNPPIPNSSDFGHFFPKILENLKSRVYTENFLQNS